MNDLLYRIIKDTDFCEVHMRVLTSPSSILLWQDVIKTAELNCAVTLNDELEAYLVTLLMRYVAKPELAHQIFATAFLKALQQQEKQRTQSLQHVGDQCLLFAGLFPGVSEKRHVKLNYFVDLGRGAYAAVSKETNDLYGSLALQFVVLMDVLQSIKPASDLSAIEAYDRWNELGSQRALRILLQQTKGIPYKK